jgi:sec-independent protein translocase protein TatC
MSSENEELTFWDHLDELRSTLVRIIGVTLLFGIAAFCFKSLLFDVVLAPTVNHEGNCGIYFSMKF